MSNPQDLSQLSKFTEQGDDSHPSPDPPSGNDIPAQTSLLAGAPTGCCTDLRPADAVVTAGLAVAAHLAASRVPVTCKAVLKQESPRYRALESEWRQTRDRSLGLRCIFHRLALGRRVPIARSRAVRKS
jgi:hypothetical protein